MRMGSTAGQRGGSTRASAPTNLPLFTVVAGKEFCGIDSQGCVTDGFGAYGNHEDCKIQANVDLKASAASFHLENGGTCAYDYIEIHGERYCGSAAPPSNVAMAREDIMTWHTDVSVTRDGFVICGEATSSSFKDYICCVPPSPPNPPTLPPTPPTPPTPPLLPPPTTSRWAGSILDTFHPDVAGKGYGIIASGTDGALVVGSYQGNASFGAHHLASGGALDAFVMKVSGAGAIDWAVRAGGAGDDQALAIASDGAGGALVTGLFEGVASFGSAIDAARLQAVKDTIDGFEEEGRFDIIREIYAEIAGGNFLLSKGAADIFMMHVTAAGTIDWAVQAGVDSASGNERHAESRMDIASDFLGGAYVTGSFEGTMTYGDGLTLSSTAQREAFVLHITSGGTIDWAVSSDGTAQASGGAVVADGLGGAIVTGRFEGVRQFGATTLTNYDGGLSDGGTPDIFVMHVTATGTIDWAVQAGGTGFDAAYGIAG